MGLFTGTALEPTCPDCGRAESECACSPEVRAARERLPPGKQTAKLAVEKRKKGKIMTVVRGLSPKESDLPSLLARLKSALGTGGTLENEEILIQGDQRDRLGALLRELGYRVK
jgi:translation initiation factor 1